MNLTEFLLTRNQNLNGYQANYAYGTSGNANGVVEYAGFAPAGTADSDAGWIVVKYTYDASQRATKTQVSAKDQIWDNRTTLF